MRPLSRGFFSAACRPPPSPAQGPWQSWLEEQRAPAPAAPEPHGTWPEPTQTSAACGGWEEAVAGWLARACGAMLSGAPCRVPLDEVDMRASFDMAAVLAHVPECDDHHSEVPEASAGATSGAAGAAGAPVAEDTAFLRQFSIDGLERQRSDGMDDPAPGAGGKAPAPSGAKAGLPERMPYDRLKLQEGEGDAVRRLARLDAGAPVAGVAV
mmetsp:Transcript_67249/g.217018  ORF Transcript_67249/g.217018 Transcript_67249/m.217018 type:complete len:211 (+) Transcript_67249:95-727(+)